MNEVICYSRGWVTIYRVLTYDTRRVSFSECYWLQIVFRTSALELSGLTPFTLLYANGSSRSIGGARSYASSHAVRFTKRMGQRGLVTVFVADVFV